jgi:hypothetical protein
MFKKNNIKNTKKKLSPLIKGESSPAFFIFFVP